MNNKELSLLFLDCVAEDNCHIIEVKQQWLEIVGNGCYDVLVLTQKSNTYPCPGRCVPVVLHPAPVEVEGEFMSIIPHVHMS